MCRLIPAETVVRKKSRPFLRGTFTRGSSINRRKETGPFKVSIMTPEQIANARDICVEEKNKIVARLQQVNAALKMPNQGHVKAGYHRERTELTAKLMAVEAQLNKLHQERRKIFPSGSTVAVTQAPAVDKPAQKDIITKLVEMRAEYEDFAADPSRIASRRLMASEFVNRLNVIIRGTINKTA